MTDGAKPPPRFKLVEKRKFVADPQVLTLRYSPCGNCLVAGGYDSRVRRWDAASDELPERAALEGHHGWTGAIAFSRDGTIFTGDSWGELKAWPLADENPRPKWSVPAAHEGWLRDAAASPDGKTLATCGYDRTVRLWSTNDGGKIAELRAPSDDLYIVRFAPDGQQLVAGDRRGIVWQWETASRKLVRQFDAAVLYKYDAIQDVGGVRAIAFDKNGEWLAVGGNKPKNGATIQGVPTLLLFDWKSGELKHTHALGGMNDCDVMDVHLHDGDVFIAVTSGGPGQGKVIVQGFADQKPITAMTDIPNVQSLAVHPDGRRLAVSGTNRDSNGNGRQLKKGKYPGNVSPIHVFSLEPASG